MKENFYDKYSFVLAGMNEEDTEYILKFVNKPKDEMSQLSERLNSFYAVLIGRSDALKRAETDFEQRSERICALVKKYNDTLTIDGIWNSVDPAEAKKKLNTFYSLLSAIEKLEGEDAPDIGGDELTEADMEIGKNISLLKRASFVIEGESKEKSKLLISKYNLSHSMAGEINRKSTAFYEKTRHNEAVLGQYISSLSIALDEKNNGERMNLSLARNCAEVFFVNYITEK